METQRPTHIQVANHFYHDSVDLLQRYEYCAQSESPDFSSLKSRRMKCFIDLRMAMESALKAIVAYYCHGNHQGEKLVQKIENYRHHMNKLKPKAIPFLPENIAGKTSALCDELDKLPVGLRYRLDVMDFIRNREKDYYATVGNDTWLKSTADTIWAVSNFIGRELNKESRIVNASDIWEEIQKPKFDKYGNERH